jgi:hypothetical protein
VENYYAKNRPQRIIVRQRNILLFIELILQIENFRKSSGRDIMTHKIKKNSYRNKHRQEENKLQGFFAFPSLPEDRVKITEKAIQKVNKESDTIKIAAWKDIEKSSSRIITNILETIDKADFFVGDISGLNPNVLFEAGYAFGRRKHTILVSQGFSTQDFHQDINDLQILSGWEISRYQNINQLSSIITAKEPSKKNSIPEFDKYLNYCEQQTQNKGLFLKASCKHEIAVSALKTFRAHFDTIVDDWDENNSQPLHWYIKAICQSTTVISLFIPSEWDNSRAINARFSFVCGMAVALNKHVRLIGLSNYKTPVDYRELMYRPTNDEQICTFLESQFIDIKSEEKNIDIVMTNTPNEKVLNKDTKEIIFLEINIGDSIAENEEHELNNYFIPTRQYATAINRRQTIIVGNKGTGKTAMFYQLRSYFQHDVRNLVCEIKPPDYKMVRFLQALNNLQEGRVEHVLESVWKFVIYCEILLSGYRKLQKRAIEAGYTAREEQILQFYHNYENLLEAPFEQKLEIVTDWLEEVAHDSDNFSKKIHDCFLNKCKDVLSSSLDVNKTVILIDNLDKSWKANANLDQQAQLVLALLGIHRRVSADLGKSLDISIVIFLRRNIFEYILESKVVREPDKILNDHIELQWNDTEMLLRVIERRFQCALEKLQIDNDSTEIWNDFFVKEVQGVSTKRWLYERVLPRPRDLIHFVQESIGYAINRDRDKIMEADLFSASEAYPCFAVEQILAEYKAEQPWLHAAILSFLDKPEKWEFCKLIAHLERYLQSSFDMEGIDVRRIIADLVGIGLLGIQLSSERIEYAETVIASRKLRSIIMAHPTDQTLYLFVHPILCDYLCIIKKQESPDIGDPKSKNDSMNSVETYNLEEAKDKGKPKSKKKKSDVSVGSSESLVRTLWKDPVLSKVIATGIIALLGTIFGDKIIVLLQRIFHM